MHGDVGDSAHFLEVEAKARWFQRIIEKMPVACVLISPSGDVSLNDRAQELLGLPAGRTRDLEEIASGLFRPTGGRLSAEELVALSRTPDDLQWEHLVLRRQDGSKAPVLGCGATLEGDGSADPGGGLVLLEEVRVLHPSEQERVEWATVVTHDLRQPLTVISTYAGLIIKQSEEEGVRKKARHILTSTVTLSRMIGDLTDAIRMESRSLEIRKEIVDAVELAREMAERAKEGIQGRELEVSLPEGSGLIYADPRRIEQVLQNLLRNARKFSFPGSDIGFTVEMAESHVRFTVVNQGEGIMPEDLPKLFSRFHRGERVRKVGISGLGLGLYIAKGLVDEHGGRIWAESEPGKTTRVSFELPLVHPSNGRWSPPG